MATTARSYTVRLRRRGQLTTPRPIRDLLATQEGEMLTLSQIDDLVVLTPRRMRLATLTESFTAEMEKSNVSLGDLLQALAKVRGAIYQERQGRESE